MNSGFFCVRVYVCKCLRLWMYRRFLEGDRNSDVFREEKGWLGDREAGEYLSCGFCYFLDFDIFECIIYLLN